MDNSETKKSVGMWLKAKGVAIGAALVTTGDYLCGDCGIIPYIIGLGKTLFGLW